MIKYPDGPILLVDGNNLARRCALVIGELTNSKNQSVGTIYGVLNSFQSFIKQYKPSEIIVAWDTGRSQWRKDLYPEYKATRHMNLASSPEDQRAFERYKEQIDILKGMLTHYPIRSLYIKGCEADDLLAYACHFYKTEHPKVIISMDHDFWQLISDKIHVFSPSRDALITPDYVMERFSVTPREYGILKAFVGDSSDEIEGFPRIGEKTAAKIIRYIREETPLDSTDIQSYLHDTAFGYYQRTKTTSIVTKEILLRNFLMMNLDFGTFKLNEVHSEEMNDLLFGVRVGQWNEWEVMQGLVKHDMNKFSANFLEYKNNWITLVP